MKKITSFTLSLIAILSFNLSNAQQTLILNPVQDAYFLSFGGGQGGNAMLKFDISSLPVGASINSVTLEVYVADTSSAIFPGPLLGNMIFKNLNSQSWLETDSAVWYDPSSPSAPSFTDSIFQLANFGDSIGWASSVDLSSILLKDYNANNNFCTVYMKDPDDMTCCGAFGPGFTPLLGNLIDSMVVGNSIGGSDEIIFYPREYTNITLIPKLIINYSLGLEITEIMYNPPEAGTDTLEFIEIYNSGLTAVDVTNYTLTGVTYTFPNVSINSGQYYVVAVNSGAFNNVFGFLPDGQFGGGLNNGGEALTIKDSFGNLVDTVFFDDSGVWPSGAGAGLPDGGGASLILCDVNSDNNDGNNWSKSVFQTGVIINGFEVLASPGSANFCCPIITSTDIQTGCDSLLWIDGNTYYANNTSATFVVKNASNCDSTITLNLTINNSVSTNQVPVIACDSAQINGIWYYASQTVSDFYANGTTTGCDSTDVTVLTINNSVTTNQPPVVACDSSQINGNWYYVSQTVTDFYANGSASGCDSTDVTLLTINTVDNTITQTNDSLTANQSGATYQWIDCNNGNAAIAGETNQLFIATANGDYAVVVTNNGCTDTSACANVLITAIINHSLSTISVFPNPANDVININLSETNTNFNFILTSIDGKIVYQAKNVSDKSTAIDISKFSNGVYFLKVGNDKEYKVFKVIIQ